MTVVTGKFKICRAGWKLKQDFCVTVLRKNSFLNLSFFFFFLVFYYKQQRQTRPHLPHFVWKSPQLNIQIHHSHILLSTQQKSIIQIRSLPIYIKALLSSSVQLHVSRFHLEPHQMPLNIPISSNMLFNNCTYSLRQQSFRSSFPLFFLSSHPNYLHGNIFYQQSPQGNLDFYYQMS